MPDIHQTAKATMAIALEQGPPGHQIYGRASRGQDAPKPSILPPRALHTRSVRTPCHDLHQRHPDRH